MVKIQLEPGQTVDTEDPEVLITLRRSPARAKAYKLVLVVEGKDGRLSDPAELHLADNDIRRSRRRRPR